MSTTLASLGAIPEDIEFEAGQVREKVSSSEHEEEERGIAGAPSRAKTMNSSQSSSKSKKPVVVAKSKRTAGEEDEEDDEEEERQLGLAKKTSKLLQTPTAAPQMIMKPVAVVGGYSQF